MSLVSYKKARDAYIAGDDSALAAMTAAISGPVAAKLGEIEHSAAEHRAAACRLRSRAATAAPSQRPAGLILALAVCTAVLALLAAGLTYQLHPALAPGQQAAQAQRASLPGGAPAVILAQPGWLALYDGSTRPAELIRVRGVSALAGQTGGTWLQVTPLKGPAYTLLLPGTEYFLVSTARA